MSKVLFMIAQKGFKDIEFLNPSNILKGAGHQVFVASNIGAGEKAHGAEGAEVKIDYNLHEVKPEDFDMIVFVGGPGALENLDNEQSYAIIRKIIELKKPLGAICIAPTILAKAGALRGKKATVWSSESNQEPIEILQKNGADYQNQPVVTDNLIVTANGPQESKEFGRELLNQI